jgi:hypothetical protein
MLLRAFAALALVIFVASGCTPKDYKQDALIRVRNAESSLPGMSVERAVEQILDDMASRRSIIRGRWYSNKAIEHETEVYKVGYEFTQNGKTLRFGWVYHFDGDKLEPITDYARQVSP